MKKQKLIIVSVPIGNPKDITLRALQILRDCDLVIGEEFKETSKFLKQNSIVKEFELYNEHSTKDDLNNLIEKVKTTDETCLISDSGTPTLEDPGRKFVEYALNKNIKVEVIPGPSALLVALSLSGFSSSPFTFIGFLSRENGERIRQLKKFLSFGHTIVIYETPYRYKKILLEISKLVKGNRKIFLGLNLTCNDEYIFRGEIQEILPILETLPKSPPVIVIS